MEQTFQNREDFIISPFQCQQKYEDHQLHIQVEFEQGAFLQDEEVQGLIRLQVKDRPISNNEISVNLLGIYSIEEQEHSFLSFISSSERHDLKNYIQHTNTDSKVIQEFLSGKQILVYSEEEETPEIIPVGTHQFCFEFALPENVPPTKSFQIGHKMVTINYFICVTFNRKEKIYIAKSFIVQERALIDQQQYSTNIIDIQAWKYCLYMEGCYRVQVILNSNKVKNKQILGKINFYKKEQIPSRYILQAIQLKVICRIEMKNEELKKELGTTMYQVGNKVVKLDKQLAQYNMIQKHFNLTLIEQQISSTNNQLFSISYYLKLNPIMHNIRCLTIHSKSVYSNLIYI